MHCNETLVCLQGDVVCKLHRSNGALQIIPSVNDQGTNIPEGSISHSWRSVFQSKHFVEGHKKNSFVLFCAVLCIFVFCFLLQILSLFSYPLPRGKLHAHLWFLVLVGYRLRRVLVIYE